MLAVVETGEADAARWDAFVAAEPSATMFHHWGWSRAIYNAYGYKSVNLAAMRDGKICGVLPLVDIRSPLFGRALISTAFTVGGGVAATDPDARRLLVERARREGERRKARYVELRGDGGADADGWRIKTGVYAGFEKELPAGEDAILKSIPRKRRAEVAKGLRRVEAGALTVETARDVDLFYALYAEACLAHGTPIFPRAFARGLYAQFGDRSEILLLRDEGRPVYAVWSFIFRDRIMPYYIGASPGAARRVNAYDVGMYRVMTRGAALGAHVFDFGRSKYGASSFDNKTYWGFEPRPLDYAYALIGARDLPNVNPQNPKFARAVSAWKKMPAPVANLAGPFLARHLA